MNTSEVSRVNWRVDDFCRAYGLGRTMVYQLMNTGKLGFIKVGKRTLIPVSEAQAWQDQRLEEGSKLDSRYGRKASLDSLSRKVSQLSSTT